MNGSLAGVAQEGRVLKIGVNIFLFDWDLLQSFQRIDFVVLIEFSLKILVEECLLQLVGVWCSVLVLQHIRAAVVFVARRAGGDVVVRGSVAIIPAGSVFEVRHFFWILGLQIAVAAGRIFLDLFRKRQHTEGLGYVYVQQFFELFELYLLLVQLEEHISGGFFGHVQKEQHAHQKDLEQVIPVEAEEHEPEKDVLAEHNEAEKLEEPPRNDVDVKQKELGVVVSIKHQVEVEFVVLDVGFVLQHQLHERYQVHLDQDRILRHAKELDHYYHDLVVFFQFVKGNEAQNECPEQVIHILVPGVFTGY